MSRYRRCVVVLITFFNLEILYRVQLSKTFDGYRRISFMIIFIPPTIDHNPCDTRFVW